MTTQSMRTIAGVSVPYSPLIADAIGYAQRLSEPYLFNHATRSWLFAAKIGQVKAIECDEEVVAVGAILHDIGLTNGVGGDNRFEVNGANAARLFINERGMSDRRAQLAWDLVALNSTASIALHKEPEVALGTMGEEYTMRFRVGRDPARRPRPICQPRPSRCRGRARRRRTCGGSPPPPAKKRSEARERLLAAASLLFYAEGINSAALTA